MSYVGFCPSGVVLPFAGSTAPEGWLLCNGSAISRTTYSALFTAISTTYGTGDGSTTFTLPDFRGVYPRGAGTNGTANYGGVTGHTPAGGSLGSKGGQKTAKNGLTASAASGSISALSLNNQNSDHVHGTGNAGSHSHFVCYGNFGADDLNLIDGTGQERVQMADAPDNDIGVYADAVGDHNHGNTGGISANHSHTLSSGTTAAQTITVGAGDTETTPAFLAVNYIIKI